VAKYLSAPEYQEFMNVNDCGEQVRFLIRKQGDRILEFVMAVSGKEEPCIISLQGEIDPEANIKAIKGLEYKWHGSSWVIRLPNQKTEKLDGIILRSQNL
jgi:hypothetical protein